MYDFVFNSNWWNYTLLNNDLKKFLYKRQLYQFWEKKQNSTLILQLFMLSTF